MSKNSCHRDRWEFRLRLADFWLAAFLVEAWGWEAGLLNVRLQRFYHTKGGGSSIHEVYINPSGATLLIFWAVVAGYLAYRLGLSSRIFLRQASLYKKRESFSELDKTMQHWVDADANGYLQRPCERSNFVHIFWGGILVLGLSAISQPLTLALGFFMCLWAYLKFPSRVVDVDPETGVFRNCFRYGGLRWYTPIHPEPMACLTILQSPDDPRLPYVLKVVTASGHYVDLFGRLGAAPFLPDAQKKAKNWTDKLHLPLRVADRGFLFPGENALKFPIVEQKEPEKAHSSKYMARFDDSQEEWTQD